MWDPLWDPSDRSGISTTCDGPHVTRDTHVGLVTRGCPRGWLGCSVCCLALRLACSSTWSGGGRGRGHCGGEHGGKGNLSAVAVARVVEWRWVGGGKGKGVDGRVAVEWRWIGGDKGEGVGGRVVARARALAVEWRSSGGGGRVAVADTIAVAVEVARLVAVVVDWGMATATAAVEGSDNNQQNLRVTKWAMARATRVIVTNAVAAIAVVLSSAVTAAAVIAAAATTITECHCPQCSHCSGCSHRPPLRHNQTAMAWVMAMEAIATATHHCSG